MNAQPDDVAATVGPCDASRVFGPGSVILRGAWAADSFRSPRPIWSGPATAQPCAPDCSSAPVVAVAGRNRLWVRPMRRGFPSPGTRTLPASPSCLLLLPKREKPARCVAASWNLSVGSCPICMAGTCTRMCLPQIWPSPVRLPLRTTGLPVGLTASACAWAAASGRSPYRASRDSHKCAPQETLRSSSFPLPGTSAATTGACD